MISDVRRQIIEGAIVPPKCLDCAYYGGPSKLYSLGLTCRAYPDGIPDTILTGKHDHANPLPGDHGIQFEKKREPKEREEPITLPLCFDCKYFRRGRRRDLASTCKAFPNGIPLPIFPEGGDHTKPYPGDHGIQFKRNKQREKKRKPSVINLLLTIAIAYTLLATIEYNWRWVFLLLAEGVVGLFLWILRNDEHIADPLEGKEDSTK